MITFTVQHKLAAGKHLFTPTDEVGQRMANFINRKNFTVEDIQYLREIGCTITVKQADLPEGFS